MAAERCDARVANGRYRAVQLPIRVGVPVRSQERAIHLSAESAASDGLGRLICVLMSSQNEGVASAPLIPALAPASPAAPAWAKGGRVPSGVRGCRVSDRSFPAVEWGVVFGDSVLDDH